MNHASKLKIACIIGTRPEAIKMASVIDTLKSNANYKVDIIITAQHRQLLDDMLHTLALRPDIDLNLMQDNQTLAALSGHIFLKLGEIVKKENYDLVLAQGDTTTTLIAAQIAFFNKIPFGHIEAGLRSYDIYHPFPEEMNRVFISKIASLHFAPTLEEKKNLLNEGIDNKKIFVTGNTVIDTLLSFAKRATPLPDEVDPNKRIILVTMHRRESFGKPIEDVFNAFIELIDRFPDVQIIYPVHPNPNVAKLATNMLGNHPDIKLIKPVAYDIFVTLLKHAYLIMTDSGGLQEEAPALNKPILILRNVTERPLVTSLGLGYLVGTDKNKIVSKASELLSNKAAYESLQKNISPYGDGRAAEKIANAIQSYFHYRLALS